MQHFNRDIGLRVVCLCLKTQDYVRETNPEKKPYMLSKTSVQLLKLIYKKLSAQPSCFTILLVIKLPPNHNVLYSTTGIPASYVHLLTGTASYRNWLSNELEFLVISHINFSFVTMIHAWA